MVKVRAELSGVACKAGGDSTDVHVTEAVPELDEHGADLRQREGSNGKRDYERHYRPAHEAEKLPEKGKLVVVSAAATLLGGWRKRRSIGCGRGRRGY